MVGRILDLGGGSFRAGGGKKENRDEDRDANPLNDALPGEVVRRRHVETRTEQQVAGVKSAAVTDLQAVLAKGSGTREKWLKKALQQAEEGVISPQDVFDIIKVPDFAKDLKEKVGRGIFRIVLSKITIFTKRQQRFLKTECALAQAFGEQGGDSARGKREPGESAAADDMMARVQAFVREKQASQSVVADSNQPALQVQEVTPPTGPTPWDAQAAKPDTDAVRAVMAAAEALAASGTAPRSSQAQAPRAAEAAPASLPAQAASKEQAPRAAEAAPASSSAQATSKEKVVPPGLGIKIFVGDLSLSKVAGALDRSRLGFSDRSPSASRGVQAPGRSQEELLPKAPLYKPNSGKGKAGFSDRSPSPAASKKCASPSSSVSRMRKRKSASKARRRRSTSQKKRREAGRSRSGPRAK